MARSEDTITKAFVASVRGVASSGTSMRLGHARAVLDELRGREALTKAAFLAATLLLAPPLRIPAQSIGTDPSWMTALTWGREQSLDFGTQLSFTYGPWGFLSRPAGFDLGVTLAAGLFCALAVVSFWLFVVKALSGSCRPLVASTIACVTTVAIYPFSSASWILVLSMIGWTLLLVAGSSPVTPGLVVAFSATSALLLQVKISEGLLAAALTAALLVVSPKGPLVAAALAGLLAGLLALWVLAGQPLANIGAWLVQSLEMTRGYADAMYLDTYGSSLWSAVLAVVMLGALVVLGMQGVGRGRAPFVTYLVVAGVVYFGLKQGFIRHDSGHEFSFYSVLVAISLAQLRASPRRAIRAAWLGLAALALAVGILRATPVFPPTTWVTGAHTMFSAQFREDRDEAARAALRDSYRVSARIRRHLGDTPVAIDPYEVNVAWAYRMNWRPVPVFQPYSAYTPALDKANAESLLAGPRMAVLREQRSLDDRLQMWDTPAYNLVLLCRFDEVSYDDRWVLLERGRSRCDAPRKVGSRHVQADEETELPRSGAHRLLTMSFQPDRRSIFRSVLSTLLKDPHPLTVRLGAGRYRLPPALAGGPLVVSLPATPTRPLRSDLRGAGRAVSFSEPGVVTFQVRGVTR